MALSPEQLQQKKEAWVAPIAPDAPAGRSAKYEPPYEALQKEVAKLESASAGSAGAVNWDQVVEHGGQVLQSLSQDLLAASFVSYGLSATWGYAGLAVGIEVLPELLDRYWASLFPELTRLRGRANALAWLVDRA